MTAVYTKLLVDLYAVTPGAPIDLGTPPVGTKWVIKHMVCSQTNAGPYPVHGFRVYDEAGAPLWVMQDPWVLSGLSYDWQGTQAIENGYHFYLFTNDLGWSLRVTGHQLTLP